MQSMKTIHLQQKQFLKIYFKNIQKSNSRVEVEGEDLVHFKSHLNLIFKATILIMPVYVYVCVCASISASKKSDLNIVSQKSQLKHVTKGSWGLWDVCCHSWSIQHLAQELHAAREAFGTAAPQADGAASCGTQHKLKTCVAPHESQTIRSPVPPSGKMRVEVRKRSWSTPVGKAEGTQGRWGIVQMNNKTPSQRKTDHILLVAELLVQTRTLQSLSPPT